MIIMGVDLGRARTGLSICDEEETLARPLTLLRQKDEQLICYEICGAAAATRTRIIVMGLPLNMDGTEGESARFAREMGEKVSEITKIPVEYVDERCTTITANRLLNDTNTRGKKRKAALDGVAATVILESYLEKRRIIREREEEEARLKAEEEARIKAEEEAAAAAAAAADAGEETGEPSGEQAEAVSQEEDGTSETPETNETNEANEADEANEESEESEESEVTEESGDKG